MNRIIGIILTLIFTVSGAFAQQERTMQIDWDYDSPTDKLAGFRIYQNDTAIYETVAKEDRTATFNVIISEGDNIFTMRAVSTSGHESGVSAVYVFNIDNSDENEIIELAELGEFQKTAPVMKLLTYELDIYGTIYIFKPIKQPGGGVKWIGEIKE